LLGKIGAGFIVRKPQNSSFREFMRANNEKAGHRQLYLKVKIKDIKA
jgi:ribosomal protein L21